MPYSVSSTPVPRGTLVTELLYYEAPPDGSAPYDYVDEPEDGTPSQNYGDVTEKTTVHDIRGNESAFNLDVDGFQALAGVASRPDIDFTRNEDIKANYYPEVEKLLLEALPGTTKVTLFDHTIRKSAPGATRGPVTTVHVDQTRRSGPWRVRLHDPISADELLRARVRIVNVWRPLTGPVRGHPLALASRSSVPDADIIPVEHRYRDRIAQTGAVRFNPAHRFYYWSGMTNDERLLIRCYDSVDDGSPTGTPHAAFVDERTPVSERYRESIEVRALVYGG